jgi:Nuclease-related domain
MAEPRFISLRRSDSCVGCGARLEAGVRAEWDATLRTITCRACVATRNSKRPIQAPPDLPGVEFDRGSPGASARRKYDKLHAKREQEAKQNLGRRIGGLYLALSAEPQSTRAWGVGGRGERLLGEYLESLHDDSRLVVLHDRRIVGSKANIDHVAVTRNGIWAIDAKNYDGKVERIDKGGWFSTDERLYVGGRDCTKLVPAMGNQLAAIRAALTDALIREFEVDLKAGLCFVDAEWSLFAKPFLLNGVWVGWAKALGERLLADGPLAPEHLMMLARRVSTALPPA